MLGISLTMTRIVSVTQKPLADPAREATLPHGIVPMARRHRISCRRGPQLHESAGRVWGLYPQMLCFRLEGGCSPHKLQPHHENPTMTTQARLADPFDVDLEAPHRDYREACNRTS